MILAIDTSTQWVGIALLDENQIIYEKIWKTQRRHTVELSPAIQSALQDTNHFPSDLSAIAAAIGPGSFTSLRIGLALAKGFALSLHIPIIGIPSLEITAAGVPALNRDLICLLRAGRGRFAFQKFQTKEGVWHISGQPGITTAQELEQSITNPTTVVGDFDTDEKKILMRKWRNIALLPPSLNTRRPAILAELAQIRFEKNDFDDPATIAPIYLRTVKNIDTN